MNLLLALTVLATAVTSFLAGASLDTSLVKLPARRRIGNIAYAVFARGNDLGNGKLVYSVWAVSAALLVFIATIIAFTQKLPTEQVLPLAVASVLSVVHFACTAKAAPVMLSLDRTPNDETMLKAKLDEFERWHFFRMIFQVLTALALLWALAVIP